MSFFFRFVLAVLAAWRLTYLLAYEEGPGGSLAKLRAALRWVGLGRLGGCFNCLSVWVALPFAFFVRGAEWDVAVVWLALSGGAVLLERWAPEPLVLHDLSPERDELLREEEPP